jgi:hypothetical protein
MKSTFAFDPVVASIYKTADIVRAVTSRMGGLSPEIDFPFYDPSVSPGIDAHRIREIEKLGDFGATYSKAPWFIKHHSTEAIIAMNSLISDWDFVSQYFGSSSIEKKVIGFIETRRDRINPVLHAIERELDPTGSARLFYDRFEAQWINKMKDESKHFKEVKAQSSKYTRKSIRKQEIDSAKVILIGFRDDLEAWFHEINLQI